MSEPPTGRPEGEVLARAMPAPARRAFGVGTLGLLGSILLSVALASPPAHLGWLAFLLVAGAGALWAAWKQWLATEQGLVLTDLGLFESGGAPIAMLDEIEALDRGVFAFKPSNGFLLRLAAPKPRHWAPGIWWRVGRRVGVGGVTGAAETRAMADILAALLARRTLG